MFGCFRYLDNNCTCPGGNELWNHTEFNTTTSTKICEGQINTCQYFNGKLEHLTENHSVFMVNYLLNDLVHCMKAMLELLN